MVSLSALPLSTPQGPWPNINLVATEQRPGAFLADKGRMSGDRIGEGKTEGERHNQGEKRRRGEGKRQAWCGVCPSEADGQMESHSIAYADLELGVLCLAVGVPGPSSCSISGSMTEGCSGVTALLPWRVE